MNYEKHLVSEVSSTYIENFIRDTMSMTGNKTSADIVYEMALVEFKGIKKPEFMKVWKDLVKEGFIIKVSGKLYKWEM